ncbi:hypothetical protein J6590_079171 [Homalodisca vitripennis]|nr:hypothetical protein J6590_079171 [Homalodisca vitripennis]
MSPQAVLPGDAMRLATLLCPDVSSVRVRIDCSTPHDILNPLTTIRKLKELSVVCVTSGERCNLDFSDISPVLEAHGETSLVSLELKRVQSYRSQTTDLLFLWPYFVPSAQCCQLLIEEVESHQVVSLCPQLETLELSGCGYVCSSTCGSFICTNCWQVIEEVESHQVVSLCPQLETLELSGCGYVCSSTCGSFISTNCWQVIEEVESHQVVSLCPQLETLVLSGCGYVCPSTCGSFMCANKPSYLRRLRLLFYADGDDFSWTHNVPQCFWKAVLSTNSSKKSRLMGIFLESPRMTETTALELWPSSRTALYPELRVASFFRYSELTLDNIKNLTSRAPLRYLRASDCERIHPKRLRQMCSVPDLVICTT